MMCSEIKLKACRRICIECPFRKGSAQGWLGALNLQETLIVFNYEHLYTCHMHREYDALDNLAKAKRGEQPLCKGLLMSANKSAKLYGKHPVHGKELRELQKSIIADEKELDLVMDIFQFMKHHDIMPKKGSIGKD